MARFTCLVVATTLLLAAALPVRAGGAPPTCSKYKTVYGVKKGAITTGPNQKLAAWAAGQLAARIGAEAHKHEGCTVDKGFVVQKACRKAVKKGEVLEGNTVVKADGTLYDMQIVQGISCPDGSFKVQYEARGLLKNKKNTNMNGKKIIKLQNIETRFINVLDSTYV